VPGLGRLLSPDFTSLRPGHNQHAKHDVKGSTRKTEDWAPQGSKYSNTEGYWVPPTHKLRYLNEEDILKTIKRREKFHFSLIKRTKTKTI
jgi:hypothetical protein